MAARSSPLARDAARLLAGLAVLAMVGAAALLLLPAPLADVFVAGWVLVAVGLVVVGAAGVATDRTPVALAAALLLAALAVVGLWSLGPFVAPAALLLLGAAVASQVDRSRRLAGRDDATAAPPGRGTACRVLAGAAVATAGAWLVYAGAVERPLFVAGCGRETLACALAVTRWPGVAATLLGLAALALGAWLLWTGTLGPVRTPDAAD